MIYSGNIFNNTRFDTDKLLKYGFEQEGKNYVYRTYIFDKSFELIIKVLLDSVVDLRVIEVATGEDYNLVFVKSAEGEFVGKVKSELEDVLTDIKEKCTSFNIFKQKQSNEVIDYIKTKYGDEPEYLWEKFPNNAVFRRNDKKGKWYAAILTVKRKTLGLAGVGEIEVLNLKAEPQEIDNLIDNERYFRAYHMNKKHWFTICLDERISIKEIYTKIDTSYEIL